MFFTYPAVLNSRMSSLDQIFNEIFKYFGIFSVNKFMAEWDSVCQNLISKTSYLQKFVKKGYQMKNCPKYKENKKLSSKSMSLLRGMFKGFFYIKFLFILFRILVILVISCFFFLESKFERFLGVFYSEKLIDLKIISHVR